MTHSDMLNQLDISAFYYYEPLLFKIFVLSRFLKTEAFPFLVSPLQSTATQIAIFINVFIYFKYTVWNRFSYIFLQKKLHIEKDVFFL